MARVSDERRYVSSFYTRSLTGIGQNELSLDFFEKINKFQLRENVPRYIFFTFLYNQFWVVFIISNFYTDRRFQIIVFKIMREPKALASPSAAGALRRQINHDWMFWSICFKNQPKMFEKNIWVEPDSCNISLKKPANSSQKIEWMICDYRTGRRTITDRCLPSSHQCALKLVTDSETKVSFFWSTRGIY